MHYVNIVTGMQLGKSASAVSAVVSLSAFITRPCFPIATICILYGMQSQTILRVATSIDKSGGSFDH